jgi:exodeoxyribonuclease V alpha subunit
VYADWLEENDLGGVGARRRLYAAARRSPGCRWPRASSLSGLTPHQRGQMRLALSRPVGVLVGTPGTGKTHCLGALVGALAADGQLAGVGLCAPTGKAAVRVTEAVGRSLRGAGARHAPTAQTVHALLRPGRNGHDGGGWGFQYGAGSPLPHRFVFLDEASMLDADLGACLFDAVPAGTHVLLVGDPYQLPPVGHGAPLRDLVASGRVPVGELTEVVRTGERSMIPAACSRVRRGLEWEYAAWPPCPPGPLGGPDLVHVEASSETGQLDALRQCIGDLVGLRLGPDDVQVIAATNDGPLGRNTLNPVLRPAFIDQAPADGSPFAAGDRVICLRNRWSVGPSGNDVYTANGEMGLVTQACAEWIVARFPGGTIRYDRPRGDESWDFAPGWAITCHKAQGSEWPVVIVLADASPGARRVCNREWLYTAMSRAKRLCVTIGRMSVLRQMTRRVGLERRKTFLAELLGETP